jgi:hypothetical protein
MPRKAHRGDAFAGETPRDGKAFWEELVAATIEAKSQLLALETGLALPMQSNSALLLPSHELPFIARGVRAR